MAAVRRRCDGRVTVVRRHVRDGGGGGRGVPGAGDAAMLNHSLWGVLNPHTNSACAVSNQELACDVIRYVTCDMM